MVAKFHWLSNIFVLRVWRSFRRGAWLVAGNDISRSHKGSFPSKRQFMLSSVTQRFAYYV